MIACMALTMLVLSRTHYEASATTAGCWARQSLYEGREQHALIGHSFLNQSGTSRVKCSMLCMRHSRCLSFNYDGTNNICQLNDARKEEFPESFKLDDGFSYFGTSEETAQGTCSDMKAASTNSPEVGPSPTTADTRGPTVDCPEDIYSYTTDATTLVPVKWTSSSLKARDDVDGIIWSNLITCRDNDDGTTVRSGDPFKVGETTITCSTSDKSGNPGQCGFSVNVIVCDCCAPLGMENGAILDSQITALNVLNDDYVNYGPALARLNSHSSWCGEGNSNAGIQVDMGHTVDLYGLIVQGRYDDVDNVVHFRLSYSDNGVVWTDITKEDGSYRLFYSSDASSTDQTVPVLSASSSMIHSRFVRIQTTGWGHNAPCMRFELIGCTN